MGKKVEVEVAPEMSLQVELKADHLVDLQVAVTEEQLMEQEEQLIEELRGYQEELETVLGKRTDVLDKAGKRHLKILTGVLTAPLKKAGVTRVASSFQVSEDHRGKLSINMEIGPDHGVKKARGTLNFYKDIPAPKELKTLDAKSKALRDKVNLVTRSLEKVKMDLCNIDRIERKARGVLAQKALESTPQGRKMLGDLKRKALPAPKK